MGVRGLFSFLKPKSTYISLEELQKTNPLRIGIDISYYIYRWQGDAKKVLNLIESLKPHKVILIFDGKAPDEKQDESNRRREKREDDMNTATILRESIEKIENLSAAQRAHLENIAEQYEKRGWQNTKEIRHKFKKELYDNDVPILKSKGEADSLLVSLAEYGNIDAVISGDMDLLVLGVKYQYAPQGDGSFRLFDRDIILEELGINDEQFRSFCALCSLDYSKQEQTLDIRNAYHGIRVFKNLTNLKLRHPEWLKEWPETTHPFFQANLKPEEWIKEDELVRFEAWNRKVSIY